MLSNKHELWVWSPGPSLNTANPLRLAQLLDGWASLYLTEILSVDELDSITWIVLAIVLFLVSPFVLSDDKVTCVPLGESEGLRLYLCAVEVGNDQQYRNDVSTYWW